MDMAVSKAMAAVEATADKAATEATDVMEATEVTGATAPQEVSDVAAARGPSCPCGSDGVKPAIRVNL